MNQQLQVPNQFPKIENLAEDLRRTEQDYERLTAIKDNLKLFITDTDQDRRSLRPFLDTIERMHIKCFMLMSKIRRVKSHLEKISN